MFIFHAFYLLQLPGVYLLGKSGWIALVRGIGAFTNIILNFLFIPKHGILGAANATCLSFILMSAIFYLINRKIFSIPYNWEKLIVILVTAGTIYFIQFNLKLDFLMKIFVSISYPAIMIFTGVFKLKHFRSLIFQ